MSKYGILFLGFILTGFGVSMMVHVSFVGLEPWGAVNVALSERMFTYGVWNMFIQTIFILLTLCIEKKLPRFGTFLNMVAISVVVDGFTYLDLFPDMKEGILAYVFFILGVVISNIGVSIVIVTGLGSGAKTQFYVTIHEKTGISLQYLKYGMELLGLLIALLLGGAIFIGTLLFVFLSGYVVGRSVPFLKKIMKAG